MAQQTAVDYLISELRSSVLHKNDIRLIRPYINHAKQMEKEHHEQTWNVAHQAGRFEGKGIAEENWQRFEQYYNETFGK